VEKTPGYHREVASVAQTQERWGRRAGTIED